MRVAHHNFTRNARCFVYVYFVEPFFPQTQPDTSTQKCFFSPDGVIFLAQTAAPNCNVCQSRWLSGLPLSRQWVENEKQSEVKFVRASEEVVGKWIKVQSINRKNHGGLHRGAAVRGVEAQTDMPVLPDPGGTVEWYLRQQSSGGNQRRQQDQDDASHSADNGLRCHWGMFVVCLNRKVIKNRGIRRLFWRVGLDLLSRCFVRPH